MSNGIIVEGEGTPKDTKARSCKYYIEKLKINIEIYSKIEYNS